jgi:precorrin-6B methylase 2
MKVFKPNLTSALLIEAGAPIVRESQRLLDLGSGGGNVGLEIGKKGGLKKIYSSDLDGATAAVVAEQAVAYGISVDHRIGSLFEPWHNERFDLIIDDVSGVAEEIAAVSPWFDGVPCASGKSGASLVTEVLAQAHRHLSPGGRVVFPIISLSDREEILRVAKRHFGAVELLNRKEWPLPKTMLPRLELLRRLKTQGYCDFTENFGMVICYTEVFLAADPLLLKHP